MRLAAGASSATLRGRAPPYSSRASGSRTRTRTRTLTRPAGNPDPNPNPNPDLTLTLALTPNQPGEYKLGRAAFAGGAGRIAAYASRLTPSPTPSPSPTPTSTATLTLHLSLSLTIAACARSDPLFLCSSNGDGCNQVTLTV